jgi:hypothetical protein
MNVSPACVLRRSARLCGRLCLGLLVLAGLSLVLGVSVRPAHALSKFTVTNCSSDSQLQADVAQANRDDAGDVITFACSGDLKLTSTLMITGSMTLSGSGQSVTLDGSGSMEVLTVSSGDSFTFNDLTVAHGSGGFENQFGRVTISNSTFAYNSGFGLLNGTSDNGDTMSISNSTIAYNSSNIGAGGLFNYAGSVSIANSTIAYNSDGGLSNQGDMTITNSTIAYNSGGSAGVDNQGSMMSISGSIVAENTGGDCFNFDFYLITDNGYNLSSDSSCGFSGTGSVQNTNPKLGPLASNGGPTQTLALLKGSPASDYIPLASGLCPKTDQRGHKRPDNRQESACDIGAYES